MKSSSIHLLPEYLRKELVINKCDSDQSELVQHYNNANKLTGIIGLVPAHMVGNLLLTERYRIGFISALYCTFKVKPHLNCTPKNLSIWKTSDYQYLVKYLVSDIKNPDRTLRVTFTPNKCLLKKCIFGSMRVFLYLIFSCYTWDKLKHILFDKFI